MYEKDYILRIIEGMGAVLRAMLASIREHRPADIFDQSRDALTLLLGLPPTLTDSLTPSGLITLLSAGGEFDAKRGRLAAEVYVRRVQAARLTGLSASEQSDLAKALRLIGAVTDAGDEDDVAEVRALLAELQERGPASEDVPS